MKKKLALVFPGGGTRGVITLELLTELNSRIEKLATSQGKNFKSLSFHTDYMAGTSIGSFIAATMSDSSMPTKSTFTDKAGEILKKNSFLPISGSYYSSESLETTLDEILGDKTFSNIEKNILITSYNLEMSEQTIFTNFGNENSRQKIQGFAWVTDEIKLKDVVQASAAVPGLLKSKEIHYCRDDSGVKKYHEVDGAMQNMTPIMDLALAMHLLEEVNFEDMFILSIGTGTLKKDIMSELQDKGCIGHIFSSKAIGVAHACIVQEATENQCKILVERYGGKFFKLEPQISLDDFCSALNDSKEQMNRYINIAQDYILANDSYLNEVAQQILDNCCL